MREITLGFCDPPKRRYLFVEKDERDPTICWHEVDFSTTPTKQLPAPKAAITGYITGVKVKEVDQGQYGKKLKLVIFMDAGEEFAIQSSITTWFSRNLLQELSAINDPNELTGPLTIAVKPGEKKNVFASLFIKTTGRQVKVDTDKTQDLLPLVRNLQSIFGDGGQDEDDTRSDEPDETRGEDEVPDHEAPWNNETPRSVNHEYQTGKAAPQQPAPMSEEEKRRHDNQVRELKRVGALAGLAFEPGTENESIIELNQHCGGLYKHADGKPKTIEQLTRDEAIEYRKTLLAI